MLLFLAEGVAAKPVGYDRIASMSRPVDTPLQSLYIDRVEAFIASAART